MLTNIFYEKFTGRFPTPDALRVAKQVWSTQLKDISDEQLKIGIAECKKWTNDFAPNLAQFIELCNKKPAPICSEFGLKYIPIANIEKAHKYTDLWRQILGRQPKYTENKQ
jgi:hypothetical protein